MSGATRSMIIATSVSLVQIGVGACCTPHCLKSRMCASHELVGEHYVILVHMLEYVGDWFALAGYVSTSRAWRQRQPALLREVRGDALLWHEHVVYQSHEDGLDPEFQADRDYARWSLEQRISYMGKMHPDDLGDAYEWSSSSESVSFLRDL